MMGDEIKLLLGRNSELWWDGLQKLLENYVDISVLAVCFDTAETIRRVDEMKPEVVLLDEEIPGGELGEIVQNINMLDQNTKIVVVIKPYKNVNLGSIFKAAAKAYIDKDISIEELVSTIRHVARGGVAVISRVVAKTLLEHVESIGSVQDKVRPEYDVGLSKREMEVLGLLAKKGMTNREIAEELFITENTVKAHLSSILEKMKVRNRQQAVTLARETRILENHGTE